MRNADLARFGQNPVPVIRNRRFSHRAALFSPVRQQFIQSLGINNRARQNVRADFRALFQNTNRDLGIGLFQPDRSGKAGWPATHDDHVIRHRFPFAHAHLLPIICAFEFDLCLERGHREGQDRKLD